MTYGTFGVGSSAHLYGLVLAGATGAKLEHVPYKGSSQAITDLLAGHVDSVLLTTSALDAMTKHGRIRLLAVSGEARTPLLPDVADLQGAGCSPPRIQRLVRSIRPDGRAGTAARPPVGHRQGAG